MKHSSIPKNVINSRSLSFREMFNSKYQINNFDNWVLSKYVFKKKMNILDLGCGNGKQIIQAHRKLKNTGRIVGIDLSKKSIQDLNKIKKKDKIKNLTLINGSMDIIKQYYDSKKIQGKFDLIHSTYAFYYSINFIKVLNFLKNKLTKNGRLIITFPGGINTLKDDYLQKSGINKKTLKYDVITLTKQFEEKFKKVKVYKFTNKLIVTKYRDLIKFTRSTGFYDKNGEILFNKKNKDKFLKNKKYIIKKNSIMIIGQNVR